MSIDARTAVTFNVALKDYMEWVAVQPYIRKKFYTYKDGVPALIKLVVKHLGGITLDRHHHICMFKYDGIGFNIEAKTSSMYSICENY
jgi:hypothetical protein